MERSTFRGKMDGQDTWQRYSGCINARMQLLLVEEEVKSEAQCGIQHIQFKRFRIQ